MSNRLCILGCGLLAWCTVAITAPAANLSVKGLQITASANGRYFETRDGRPFFYLGDTAWTLFKRLDREEVEDYLRNRAAKGFTVVQAYVLRGLTVRDLYGELTLIDGDPTKLNPRFFANVDWIVNRANELGLVVAMAVSHGEHVIGTKEKVFDPSNAYIYGKLLGARYRNNAVIWLLGGDRNPTTPLVLDTWSAMARGLKDGSGNTQLVSYHGSGPGPNRPGCSSSYWLHDKDWLDFNMLQSGHWWGSKNYEFITHDYELKPVKPTIDGEARYEDHPDLGGTPRRMGAHEVREAAYWAILAGAAGHAYGCNNIWQFYDPQRPPDPADKSFPFVKLRGTTPWRQAMNSEGASSMAVMRRLFAARPWYRLVPDQSLIVSGQGEGEDHAQAARAADGSFLLAYLTFGNPVTIDLGKLSGRSWRAHWFDPRTGSWHLIGEFPNNNPREFKPPTQGPTADWVLVMDDAAKKFAEP